MLFSTYHGSAELWTKLAEFTISNSNELIFWVKEDGYFLYINQTALQLLGYDSKDLQHLRVPDIMADYDDENRNNLRELIDTRGRLLTRATLICKNGQTIPVESVNNAIKIDGQKINCALARDMRDELQAETRHQIQQAILENENKQLKSTFNASDRLNIIGTSRILVNLLEKAKRFSENDRPVIITGESGVGKESMAHFVHLNSKRCGKKMIVLNCATLKENDIISHLFGHTKGAFTGATSNRIGLFTLANDSTLFLDEVGELSLNLQAMLLRVLQEGQFTSMGSNKTLTTNARIITATNRDLNKMVVEKTFRQDLLYRLNVLSLRVPALRKRKKDIRQLLDYKLSQLNQQYGKNILPPKEKEYASLETHPFPGNIRELFNLIERAYFSANSASLNIMEHLQLSIHHHEFIHQSGLTLSQNEDYYIRKILDECDWQIAGDSGAAKALGVKRSTLISKMQKLGIKKSN